MTVGSLSADGWLCVLSNLFIVKGPALEPADS